MFIREAVESDAAILVMLIRQLGYHISETLVKDNINSYAQAGGHVLVAEQGGILIGFLTGAYLPLFHEKGQILRITALCVSENHRRGGTGRKLVKAIEQISYDNGCYYIEVTSGAHRSGDAHLFYTQLGYREYEGKRFLKRFSEQSKP